MIAIAINIIIDIVTNRWLSFHLIVINDAQVHGKAGDLAGVPATTMDQVPQKNSNTYISWKYGQVVANKYS